MKVGGCWLCEHHADALAQASERWSGINWLSLTQTGIDKQPDLNDPDGEFWDDEEEQ